MAGIIDVLTLFGNDSGELDENLQLYFVQTEDYKRILSGNIFLVSGKRGTGKSSIARIMKETMKDVILLRPTNIEIDNIRDEAKGISREVFEPKLAKVWLNTIYGEVAKYVSKVFPQAQFINTKYLMSYIDFLNNTSNLGATKFIDSFIDYLQLLTNANSFSHINKYIFNNPDIEIIDKEIKSVLGDSSKKVFVLFDNLDDDYDLDPDFTVILVNALITAGLQIIRQSKSIIPIIFIRNDILSYIAKSKNSFISQIRSNKVDLKWSQENLLKVINARFSVYFDKKMPESHLETHPTHYLKKVFPEKYEYHTNTGFIKCKPIGYYIIERSLMRPREVVQFCRKIIEINGYKYPISNNDIRLSEPKYVSEFIEDLCKEYNKLYPNLWDVIELFRKGRFDKKHRGWNWTRVDLKHLFDENYYIKDHNLAYLDFNDTVNVLFKVGFLRAVLQVTKGERVKQNYVSCSDDPDFNTDRVDEFDIHRLFRSQLKFEKR